MARVKVDSPSPEPVCPKSIHAFLRAKTQGSECLFPNLN